MKSYSENRFASFGWGGLCGAIAALLAFTAGYIIKCDQSAQASDSMSLAGWFQFIPWFWTLAIAAFFGLLNSRRNRRRTANAIDALDAVDVIDILDL